MAQFPPKAILAPVNDQPYSLEGFYFAERVAAAHGASLTVLHVARGSLAARSARRQLKLSVARLGARVPVCVRVREGEPVEAILAESASYDLLVLVAHRKGALHDAVLGTTAEQVLRRCRVPVLCVPPGSSE